jgi:hypothetical protein
VLLLNAYFSLSRAAWIPCVIAWDAETGEFRRDKGPEGLTTWKEADEASRFLVGNSCTVLLPQRECLGHGD